MLQGPQACAGWTQLKLLKLKTVALHIALWIRKAILILSYPLPDCLPVSARNCTLLWMLEKLHWTSLNPKSERQLPVLIQPAAAVRSQCLIPSALLHSCGLATELYLQDLYCTLEKRRTRNSHRKVGAHHRNHGLPDEKPSGLCRICSLKLLAKSVLKAPKVI